jgi:hypothetical protein
MSPLKKKNSSPSTPLDQTRDEDLEGNHCVMSPLFLCTTSGGSFLLLRLSCILLAEIQDRHGTLATYLRPALPA